MYEQYVTLKFGTLKGWEVDEGNKAALQILGRYHEIGTCFSVAAQKDTPEQKQLLIDLIRLPNMQVYLDWDNKFVTQEEGVRYIEEYGKENQAKPLEATQHPQSLASQLGGTIANQSGPGQPANNHRT